MQVKINAKDLASGIFLLLVALIGIYLNQDHNLGTARRMGPGYMPLMVFYIQGGLAALVIFFSLFSGPDPLEKWTGLDAGALVLGIAVGTLGWKFSPLLWSFFGQTYNAVGFGITVGFLAMAISSGWKLLAIISASVALFGLILEKGGFFAALTAVILVSCAAEHTHTKKGVAGLLVFLLVLCWWVFIYELDIRVNLWPQS
ncbi:hypothetical protein [Sediminicoccus sp. KRV36]|uniref:hypothetical protein n=1 Tax=Sediminicoccus sp. KRV36 TaxID=3133721 RepID=UPI00200CA2A8|nr:hypothetical protein [Sediminicoccus rosea]UPY37782.1 hypothetical protein LHU95_03545 [Sediminicoccus rosea]